MKQIWQEQNINRQNLLIELFEIAKLDIAEKSYEVVQNFENDWESTGFDLQLLIVGQAVMVTYLIHCSRILEILGIAYLLIDDQNKKKRIMATLCSFLEKEAGCGHPPSDNYAISLIPPVLALLSAHERKSASSLLRRAAIWICDRYEDGEGIAPFGALPEEEIQILLGYPFDFFDVDSSGGSFVATAISDLSIFISNNKLYEDIVNDIRASGIIPIYWQVHDTPGQFEIDGRDVIAYPNVGFDETYSDFDNHDYATHIRHEKLEFRLSKLLGPDSLLLLMVVLRDRYFPGIWTNLLEPRATDPL